MRKKLLDLILLGFISNLFYANAQQIREDFENSGAWAWSPWIVVGTATSTKTTTAARNGQFGLTLNGDWSYRTDFVVGNPGDLVSAWFKFNGSGRLYLGFGASSSGCFSIVPAPNTTTLIFQQNSGFGYTDLTSVTQTYNMNQWYKIEVLFNTTTNVTATLYDANGTTVINTLTTTISGLTPGGIAMRGFGTVDIDDFAAGPPTSGGGGPTLPPIANFFPSVPNTQSTPIDTVWLNSPYTLVSTSQNASRTYWDLPNVTNLPFPYFRQSLPFTTQQYIDTLKYNRTFTYTFNQRGFHPVRLLAVNYLKIDSLRDSIVRFVYVDTPSRVPKTDFISFKRKVGFGDYANMLDLSSYGP
ncbi:MAG: hypothetical protein ACK4K9_08655, partial [Bacteroidia bacterium]